MADIGEPAQQRLKKQGSNNPPKQLTPDKVRKAEILKIDKYLMNRKHKIIELNAYLKKAKHPFANKLYKTTGATIVKLGPIREQLENLLFKLNSPAKEYNKMLGTVNDFLKKVDDEIALCEALPLER